MKKSIISMIIISMLICCVACGDVTGKNGAASGSAVSGSALSVGDTDQSTDLQKQVQLLLEKKETWLQGENVSQLEYVDFSVTDMDQNGRLEICRIEWNWDDDEGIKNMFWEINESCDDLEELQLDEEYKTEYLIERENGYGSGFYEEETDTWHYLDAGWLGYLVGNSDTHCVDMRKTQDKLDIRICKDTEKPFAGMRKFYYQIHWFDLIMTENNEERLMNEEELLQELNQSAQTFRFYYRDEMGEEVDNAYFPYHEDEQKVKMQITWPDYEGITGEVIYKIIKVDVGLHGTLYYIDDYDIKNVYDTKTGKKKPRSWWGERVYDMARGYLWVTDSKIWLVQDFHGVVDPGQNAYGELLFEDRIHENAICICDEEGNSPIIKSIKRQFAWEKNVGLVGYRRMSKDYWANYVMQQKNYQPFENEK